MDLCGVVGVRNRIERRILEECRISLTVKNLGLIRHVGELKKKGQLRQAVDRAGEMEIWSLCGQAK